MKAFRPECGVRYLGERPHAVYDLERPFTYTARLAQHFAPKEGLRLTSARGQSPRHVDRDVTYMSAAPVPMLDRRRSDAAQWGGVPGCRYRLVLKVIPMGNANAVDIAQTVHERVLEALGCLEREETLRYAHVMPGEGMHEGCYVDDHFVLGKVHRKQVRQRKGRGYEIIKASHEAYHQSKLVRAPEKKKRFGFSSQVVNGVPAGEASLSYTILGTHIDSGPGLAGTELESTGTSCVLPLRSLASLSLLSTRLGGFWRYSRVH